MPYYSRDTIATIPSSRSGASPLSGGMPVSRTVDLSWRTRTPSDGIVRIVPTATAEPYSWFLDLQEFRKHSLIDSGRFDASQFREDRGHPWSNEKWTLEGAPLDFSIRSSSTTTGYMGVWPSWFIADDSSSSTNWNTPSSSLESWGALQYGRMAPVVSEFSLSTMLGELHEGLPRLIPDLMRRADIVKAAGSDFLNVEFGWLPLLGDLQKLALGLLEASYGLFRPFGANHRRRDEKPITSFVRYDNLANSISAHMGANSPISQGPHPTEGSGAFGGISLRGQYSTVRRSSITRSMEGEFVYIPKAGFNPQRYLDRLETLVSIQITPATLWELSPFSWLVDWFTDIGGAVSSMEAAMTNRILSTYCYAMEETETSVSNSIATLRHVNSPSVAYIGPSMWAGTQRYVRKRRIRANPFGFTGTSNTRPTGEKAAILVALGLTRS